MNARKKLKKLKSENKFLREIIKDHAEMERVYHLWTGDLKIHAEPIKHPEIMRVARIYPKKYFDNHLTVEYAQRMMVRDCTERIREIMKWTTLPYCGEYTRLEGELMVIKEEESEGE